MNRQKLSKKIRREVAQRAGFRCEYCHVHEDDMFLAFEIDHIIALKHGGSNSIENLAYCCPHCNQNKGSDIATYDKKTKEIIPLFNPRKHRWDDYFTTVSGEILGRNNVGSKTTALLKMNEVDLIVLRQLLTELKRFP